MTNLSDFPAEGPEACPFCSKELGLEFQAQEVEAGFAYSCTACHSMVFFVPKDPSTVDLGRRFASEEDGTAAKVAQGWGQALSEEEFMSDAIEKDLIPPGLKAYFRIMKLWGVGEEEASVLLGYDHRPDSTEIGIDPLKRISHTLGIYRALHSQLSRESANAWIKKPNTADLFKGRPALDLLHTGTQGFEQVRNFLAANLS